MAQEYDVPAIKRTDDILSAVAASAQPITTAMLMEKLQLSRSTLYLLLSSMERRRWIQKSGDGYRIGLALFGFGNSFLKYDNLQESFATEATKFVDEYNEVVQLAMLENFNVVYLARKDSMRPVGLISNVGTQLPANCCALGKTLLASLPDEEIKAILPDELGGMTDKSVVNKEKLLRELIGIRKKQVACERSEVSIGLNCFAAYVGETASGMKVAVSTSIPEERYDAEKRKSLTLGIRHLADRIRSRII